MQFTVTRETHDKLRRVQDLLRHSVPNGDPAVIFDRALTLLLAELEKKKLARTDRPRQVADPKSGSRHVPAAVKREVWKRDGGRCTFIGTGGRCSERGWLEFHHVIPFAEGGETTSANLQLRCRAHNAYEAEAHFGPLLLREAAVLYRLGPDRLHQIEVDEQFVAVDRSDKDGFRTRDRVLTPTPSAHGQAGPPAVRVSFAATSDSRDTRSCKARPQRDCRVGLRGPTRVAEDNAEGALFHATPPQRASVRVGDPGSAGARTRCATAGRRDVAPR